MAQRRHHSQFQRGPQQGALLSSNLITRIVVVGSEGCTGAILGTGPGFGLPSADDFLSVTGRSQQWAEAGQSLGCGEVIFQERTVNCPTSKQAQKPQSKKKQGGLGSPDASLANLDDGRSPNTSTDFVTSTRLADAASVAMLGEKSSSNLQDRIDSSGNNGASGPQRPTPVSQIIHAKCITLSHLVPALTLEFFEINEGDVQTLKSDQLFGPYVLHSNTAGVVLVIDCGQLFPAPPTTALLIESVESVAKEQEKQYQQQLAAARAGDMPGFSAFASPMDYDPHHISTGQAPERRAPPTLTEMLESYRARQDAAAAHYIETTAERITAMRHALDTWAGEASCCVPLFVSVHNTEVVTQRLEAWSVTTTWAKISDIQRAKVLAKLPKVVSVADASDGGGNNNSSSSSAAPASAAAASSSTQAGNATTSGNAAPASSLSPASFAHIHSSSSSSPSPSSKRKIPSLQSCCAPEPFISPAHSLHLSHPQVAGTLRAIRNAITQVFSRVGPVAPFYPVLTSTLDQTPMALLSSVVARPHVFSQNTQLQEIVHQFKTKCFFRRVFAMEPRTGLAVSCDRLFPRYLAGGGASLASSSSSPSPSAAAASGKQHGHHHHHPHHRSASPAAHEPGIETSFTSYQNFIQDYLAVVDACRMTSAFSYIVSDDATSEAALVKAAFDKVEPGEILNVAEGGLASLRGSLELSNGEGVYLYGLAPPVPLILGCIGDCAEVQRMESLIEFNLHIVQTTTAGLFEEALKRARAAGYEYAP